MVNALKAITQSDLSMENEQKDPYCEWIMNEIYELCIVPDFYTDLQVEIKRLV